MNRKYVRKISSLTEGWGYRLPLSSLVYKLSKFERMAPERIKGIIALIDRMLRGVSSIKETEAKRKGFSDLYYELEDWEKEWKNVLENIKENLLGEFDKERLEEFEQKIDQALDDLYDIGDMHGIWMGG